MIKQFASNITSFLLSEDIILADDREVYEFGTEQILVHLAIGIAISAIATIFKILTSSIFFLLGFIALRMTGGGYHADTRFRCNILTLSVYMISMSIIQFVRLFITKPLAIGLCLITICLIFLFAPVDHKNMIFSKFEVKRARRKSIIVAITISVCSLVSILKIGEVTLIPLSLIFGAFVASLSIFIGNIKRRKEKHEENEIIR